MARKRDKFRTRGELIREELNETIDHAMRAAGHAASGIDDAVRPRMTAARESMGPAAGMLRNGTSRRWSSGRARLGPLTEAAQSRFREFTPAREEQQHDSGSRWPRVVGMLVFGATAGAVAAMMLRRRRQRSTGGDAALLPGAEAGTGQRTETDPLAAVSRESGTTPGRSAGSATGSRETQSWQSRPMSQSPGS